MQVDLCMQVSYRCIIGVAKLHTTYYLTSYTMRILSPIMNSKRHSGFVYCDMVAAA